MGSTFSGLNVAYLGLTAARMGLEIAGQNISNAKTPGYTRQRAELSSNPSVGRAGMFAQPLPTPGGGVTVDSISRLGNIHADARVRTASASYGFHGVRAEALRTLETRLNEPGENGLSAALDKFWSSWSDLANNPGKPAAAGVVIEQATVIASQIAEGYRGVDQQWSSVRATVNTATDELNNVGRQIAELNDLIRYTAAAGGSVNELVDKRALLATTVAQIAGGQTINREDGSIDVLIGGNPLVTGPDFNEVRIVGGTTLGDNVQLEWTKHPGLAIPLDGGELGANLNLLLPAASGGVLAQAAQAFNDVATTLAATVNAVHQTGATPTGTTGLDFFSLTTGAAPALGLNVIATGVNDIAAGKVGGGALDSSIADKISQLGTGPGSADNIWATFVTGVGVIAQAENQQATLAELASNNAFNAQQAQAGVDLDEENLQIVESQTAYQAAARVMTAIDEMLDTLINKTGLVGR
ncbi:flagellar hook-associated protein FlgK [Agromyces humi]|uniref:flagellar hook-associated protein FlgK n=1 Tax=Agromyces humi TaxID=1766800 RepID=UPI001F3D1627|nr:flagellar hook-associated protein FlgK [Agromyces humi]